MKPLEAYAIISQCMDELQRYRQYITQGQYKGYSEKEIKAQVIAFEALRRMEEEA